MNISTSSPSLSSSSPNRGDVLNIVNRYINTIDNFNSNITILLNNYNTINPINENTNPRPTIRRNDPVQTRTPHRTSIPHVQNVSVPNTGNTRAAPARSRAAPPRQSGEYINNPLNLDYNSGDDIIQNWTFRIDLRDEENAQRGPLYNYFYNYLTRQFNDLGDLNLTDVVVAPTETEIQNATRNIVFDASGSHVNTNCPISLEPFEHGQEVCEIIYCGHLFNNAELQNWFRGNVRCPVCRYDIRNYSQHSNRDINNANTTQTSNTRLNLENNRNRMSELFGNILQSFNSTTSTSRLNYVSATELDYPASLM